MEPLVDMLVREYSERFNGYQAVCTGLFLQIITVACRSFSSQASDSLRTEFTGKEEAVSQAISFLESQYDREITINDVAGSVWLSRSRLSHLFKEVTGTSLMDYLLRYRLERARLSLQDRTRTITQNAYSVGFHDPAYFSRAFKKYFGVSPRESISRIS